MGDYDKIIIDNIKLVPFVINKHFNRCFEYVDKEELISEGYVGLCKAARSYNSNCSEFSTYACSIIRGTILNYINRRGIPFAFSFRKGSKYEHVYYSSFDDNIINDNEDEIRVIDIIASMDDDFNLSITKQDALLSFVKSNSKYGYDIFDLLCKGFSQSEIANSIGIAQSTVSRIIEKAKNIYYNRNED